MRTIEEAARIEIGRRIAHHMGAAGMGASDVAKQLGVAPTQVSRWIAGRHCPSVPTVLTLCVLFRCDVGDLLGSEKDWTWIEM